MARVVWMAMILGVVGCDDGSTTSGSPQDGLRFSGGTLEVFGDIETDEVTFREGEAYAAVVNRTGSNGRLFRVGVDLLDDGGVVVGESSVYCASENGGSTVRDGDVAHCWWSFPETSGTAVSAEVGFVEADPPNDSAPGGFYRVDGEPTYGDAGSSFGWVEARVCRKAGISDIHDSLEIEALVLDADGFPWDRADSPQADPDESGCGVARVGDLEMPDDPIVIATP